MPLLYTGLQNRNIRIMENDQEILETEDSEEYEEGTDNSEFRRKRVKRIKGILIFLLIFFLIVPNIVCGFLLFFMIELLILNHQYLTAALQFFRLNHGCLLKPLNVSGFRK